MDHDVANPPSDPVVLTPVIAPKRGGGGIRLHHLMYGVVVAAFLFWLAMLAKYWLVLGLILGGTVLAVTGAVLLARRNALQEESLLWALAIAAERRMPLGPAVLAFADQYSQSYRWRVQLLAAVLDEGATLPEAIDQVPGLLHRETLAMLRTGWATGTLPEALRQAAQLRTDPRTAWGDLLSRLSYLLWILLSMQLVIAFLFYFIAPKLQAIFADFGIPLPALTQRTFEAAHWLGGPGALVMIPIVLLELFAIFVLPLGSFNFFQLDIPLLDRLFRRRHTALILRSLALGVQGQRPMPDALNALAEHYPSSWVRARLRLALVEVNQGGDWVGALMRQGLLRRADAALLMSAQRVGNLDWALGEAAASVERRAGYRVRVLTELLSPLAIATMGALVFLVAVGYFLPLITLIQRLA